MQSNPTLAGHFLNLHRTLTRLGFDGWHTIRECDVFDGCPHVYAVFLRFIYSRFPSATAQLLRSYPWFIIEDNAMQLGTTSIRVLSEAYKWGAAISGLQYAKRQFAVAKIALCLQLVQCLRRDEERLTVRCSVAPRVHHSAATGTLAAPKKSTSLAETLAAEEHAVIRTHRSQLNAMPRT